MPCAMSNDTPSPVIPSTRTGRMRTDQLTPASPEPSLPVLPMMPADHGLWTAGIIGSTGNDGSGDAGVSWSVRIRPVRVLGITGEGVSFDIAQGILYAAGLSALGSGGQLVMAPSRAQIINISL